MNIQKTDASLHQAQGKLNLSMTSSSKHKQRFVHQHNHSSCHSDAGRICYPGKIEQMLLLAGVARLIDNAPRVNIPKFVMDINKL